MLAGGDRQPGSSFRRRIAAALVIALRMENGYTHSRTCVCESVVEHRRLRTRSDYAIQVTLLVIHLADLDAVVILQLPLRAQLSGTLVSIFLEVSSRDLGFPQISPKVAPQVPKVFRYQGFSSPLIASTIVGRSGVTALPPPKPAVAAASPMPSCFHN